jgi:hypothetical protein
MALVETIVGERKAGANVQADARGGAYSELITNDVGLGRYFEAARYNRLYTSMVKAVTVAATHNSPIAAATATPVLGLFNPANSGKAAVFQRMAFLTTSGTPAGGQGVLNAMTVTTPTTAALTGSIFSNLLNNSTTSPQGSVCKVYNNVALTGIVPTASNEIDLVGGASAAAAAGNGGPGLLGEDVGGRYIAPPGVLVALMAGSGAGTTWIVNAAWSWVEVDWPL